MIFTSYFCHYLTQQSALSTLVNGQINLRKRPQKSDKSMYIVVNPAEAYDHGNHSTGALTTKQEDFTILIVGREKTVFDLQPVLLALLSILDGVGLRQKFITLSSAVPPTKVFCQCVLIQNQARFVEGAIFEGNEDGDPCYYLPMKASYDLPVLA